jgi:hypothetical protein
MVRTAAAVFPVFRQTEPHAHATYTYSHLLSSEANVRQLPRSGDFHYQIHARTRLNDNAVICRAIPKKLVHYCDPAAD